MATRRSAWLRRPVGVVRRPADVDEQAARAIVREALEARLAWLDPGRTRELLRCYGLPACDQRIAASADEAIGAAEELGLPAVVKTARPGVHKTELGGVAIDLHDAAAVAAAFARIGGPVIVQPMISGGSELLCGLVQDPVFGPVVALAAGGVLTELSGPANVRVVPITDVDADELVSSGVAGALLAGARGRDPGDAAAVADVLHRLSALGHDLPEVAELDLNPVLVMPRGCIAVDARVRMAAPASVRTPRTCSAQVPGSSWTITTGQCACAAHCWLTDPSSRPAKPPCPREPTTSSSAPSDSLRSTAAGVPSVTTRSARAA